MLLGIRSRLVKSIRISRLVDYLMDASESTRCWIWPKISHVAIRSRASCQIYIRDADEI